MDSEVFQLDTKDTCLLCFSECTKGDGSLLGATPAFKMLLRYLKIDLMKLGHLSSTAFRPFLSGPDSVNISVNLCQYCSSVTTDFLQLFKDFERLRMKLDNCAQELHQAMDEGANDDVRVREYRNRVGPLLAEWMRPEDGMHSSIADILRKETMEKCVLRLAHSLPRVFIKDEPSPETQKTMSESMIIDDEAFVNINKSETPIPSPSTQAEVEFLHLEERADAQGVDDNPSLQMQDPLEMCNGSFEGSNAVLEFETQLQGDKICTGKLHKVMEKGVNDGVRDREYRNRVGQPVLDDWILPEDVIHSSIVDIVTKTTVEKSAIIKEEISRKIPKTSSSTFYGSSGIEEEKISKIFKSDPESPSNPTSPSTHTNADVDFDDIVDDNPPLSNDPSEFCNVVLKDATDEETRPQILTNTNGVENIHDRSSDGNVNDPSCTNSLKHKCQCPHCNKSYPTTNLLKDHLMMAHTLEYFSNRLPVGTTEQQLQLAIQEFLTRNAPVPNPANTKPLLFECQWCRLLFPRRTFGLQLHVFMIHFDDFVNTFLADNSTRKQDKIVVDIGSAADASEIPTFDDDSDVEIYECSSPFPAKDPLALEEDSGQANPAPEQKQSTTLQIFVGASHADNPGSSSSTAVMTKAKIQDKRRIHPNLVPGEYACQHCGKVLRNLRSLQSHIGEFHSKVRKRFMCNHCNKVFTRQPALRTHWALEHTFTRFNNRFPSGTTEDEYKNVVDKLIAQPRKICVVEGDVLTTKLGCQYCEKIFHHIRSTGYTYYRRAHVVKTHLDHIINILEQGKGIGERIISA